MILLLYQTPELIRSGVCGSRFNVCGNSVKDDSSIVAPVEEFLIIPYIPICCEIITRLSLGILPTICLCTEPFPFLAEHLGYCAVAIGLFWNVHDTAVIHKSAY